MTDQQTRAPFPVALSHLKSVQGWLLWRWVEKPNKPGEFTKPPFQPRNPDRNASNRNPAHWTDFAAASAARKAGKADGLGFVVSASQREVWVDLDDCRNPETGGLAEWAERYVRMAASYTEVTPSGRGIRIVGVLTGSQSATPIHKPYRLPGGGRGEVFYRADRYVTITGKRLDGTPDELRPIDETVSLLLSEAVSVKSGQGESRDLIPAVGEDDDDPVMALDDRPPLNLSGAVSYTHLTLPTILLV